MTLTVGQLPRHGHDIYTGSSTEDGKVDKYWCGNGRAARSPSTIWNLVSKTEEGGMCKATGGGESINNMPSYQTLYSWRRIE